MKKIALITGASSGIGKACAIKFASCGYNVIITGRRKENLETLKMEIEARFEINVLMLPFDIQDQPAVNTAIGSLASDWQQIDVVVNNAGLAAGRDFFEEALMDDWETMINTNVKGLLYLSKAVLPFMISRRKGHIINLGSTAGKEVYEKGNVYCATKSAVDAITKGMRIDLLRHNIKVTSVHPGATETEFSIVRLKGDETAAKKVYEGYQPLTAEDVAEVVYFPTTLPDHVCINDLVMTCTAQANSFYTFKS